MNGLAFGKRHQGKTTLALHLARQLDVTLCAFDINRQFHFSPDSAVSTEDDVRALLLAGEREIIFRPGLDVKADFEALSRALCDWQDLVILVDESSRLQGANWLHPWLDELIRRSDSERVHLIQTLHRPSDAANICRALASDWYIFHTTQPASLGCIADQCGREVAELAVSLGPREFVHWNDDRETFEQVTDPESWFESLSRPEAFALPQANGNGGDHARQVLQ